MMMMLNQLKLMRIMFTTYLRVKRTTVKRHKMMTKIMMTKNDALGDESTQND